MKRILLISFASLALLAPVFAHAEAENLPQSLRARLAAPDTLRGAASSVGQMALPLGLPASYPRSVRRSPVAHAGSEAGSKSYTVLLAGGEEANMIKIWLSSDGRQYVIDSVVPLEVGGEVCAHAEGNAYELLCSAPAIGGFEVNAGGGDDRVHVSSAVAVPVTLRGEAGDDVLIGGSGTDKLIGGRGNDRLFGGRGNDQLYGGPGDDTLFGGPGDDLLNGGSGMDALNGGPGNDVLRQGDRAGNAAEAPY